MCVRGISLPYSPNNCVCMHVFLPLTEMNAAVTSDETPMGWSDACKGVELPPLTCSGATRLRGGDQLTTLNIFLRAQGDCLVCSSFSFYPHTHQASGLASRGGWAEPRPRTFGSWRLASPLAYRHPLGVCMFLLLHHDSYYIISCTLLACTLETFDISVQ